MTSNHYNHFILQHHLKDGYAIYNLMEQLQFIFETYPIPLDHVALDRALSIFKTTMIGGVVLRYEDDAAIHKDVQDNEELILVLLNWHWDWSLAGNKSTSPISIAFEALAIARAHHQAQELHHTTQQPRKQGRVML